MGLSLGKAQLGLSRCQVLAVYILGIYWPVVRRGRRGGWSENIWLPDALVFLSWLRALAMLGVGGERQGNGSGAREGSWGQGVHALWLGSEGKSGFDPGEASLLMEREGFRVPE